MGYTGLSIYRYLDICLVRLRCDQ